MAHQRLLDPKARTRPQAGDAIRAQAGRLGTLQRCRCRQHPGVVQRPGAAGDGLGQVPAADGQQQPLAGQIQAPQVRQPDQQGRPVSGEGLPLKAQQQLALLPAALQQRAADLGGKRMGGIDQRSKGQALRCGLLQLGRQGDGPVERPDLQLERGTCQQRPIGKGGGGAHHRHAQRPAALQQLGSQAWSLTGSSEHPQPVTLVHSGFVVQDGRHRGFQRA